MSPRTPIRLPDAPGAAGATPLPRNLLDAMADAGLDAPALARASGLDPGRIELGLSRDEADRFLCAAWQAAGNPAFGLLAGSRMRAERLGVAGLAAMTSPTFGVALERKARYSRLVWGDAYRVEREAGVSVRVTVLAADESRPYGAAKIDMELASLLTFGRHFTGRAIVPIAVGLRQSAPSYRDHYAGVFGCPVAFGQPVNFIRFHAADADLPLQSANPLAGAWLESAAESALNQLDAAGLGARVRTELGRLLQDGAPTLASVARALHLSERTLQRRLSAEGVSFTRLLDDMRSAAAQRQLAEGQPNVPELAFVLGFADTNSFYRAFRRWTGTTPEAFRRGRPSMAP